MRHRNFVSILLLLLPFCLSGAPFFGGYTGSVNRLDNNKFITANFASFYLQNSFNDNILFYLRLTGGIRYYANLYTPEGVYDAAVAEVYTRDNGSISHFSFIPNIDLLYVEFKTNSNRDQTGDEEGETHYDLFITRLGRIHLHQDDGFILSMKGDGFDSRFNLKNFRFRIFAITNSFDYLPFFDFIAGNSKPVFTNWDNRRYPLLSSMNKSYEVAATREEHRAVNGFISDVESQDYNFYFEDVNEYDEDYDENDRKRLNTLRYAAVIAGRIFTGFTFEIRQVFYQNFAINFLANVDLIPTEFVITYPSRLNAVHNTFGGRYSSFYIGFSARGKIFRNLYYDFEGVYETGINVTYYNTGDKIKLSNGLINSFALNTGFTYFFNHITKPTAGFRFMYAHGDQDVQFKDGTVLNKFGQDNTYRSPTSPGIGNRIVPFFSNIAVFSFENSIKPFSGLKREVFSRLYLKSALLIYLRPVIKGNTFFSEKAEYIIYGDNYENYEKVFLGVEIDTNLVWQIFSDISVDIKGGILIPNYAIYANNDVLWTVGLSAIISF